MGCDGGTIPKRNEIVKNKQSNHNRDKDADLSARWQFCYLSGLRLKKPIVACQLGRLYNKDAILEYLIELKSPHGSDGDPPSNSSKVSHIKSLKDVKTLNLREKTDFDQGRQATSSTEAFKAQYSCPISGLDINGKYKFYFLFSCGCVFSERALKEVSNEHQCIVCSNPYNPDVDLIVLNGNEAETRRLKDSLINRKRQQRREKHQNPPDAPGPCSSRSTHRVETHKNKLGCDMDERVKRTKVR